MNPITTEMLRDDWSDDPNLTEDEVALLSNLSDETLQDALDHAFGTYEDVWYSMLDEVRGMATRRLLGTRKELGL